MPWVRYDEKFVNHPKVVRAAKLLGGEYAKARILGVHMEATGHSNSHRTDGFVSDEVVETFTSDPRAKFVMKVFALRTVRLAHRERGGWRLHDYLDYQPSKEEMLRAQQVERDRKRRQRANGPADVPGGTNAGQKNVPPMSQRCPGVPDRTGPDRTVYVQEQRADARGEERAVEERANPRVLVKLAHTVMDDIDRGLVPENEVVYEVKDRAARAKVFYGNFDEVHRAVRSAEVQRTLRRRRG